MWKDSPILKGSTKFEPLPGVKNIMITGGAGFMYAFLCRFEACSALRCLAC
ncbi:hypothetical protein IMZ48_00790 [Candidatus Bathyarchaeota archaeon]|nr:hypothetical protein [Candidatus Bathyarchaeota archaeon]